jgi:hypothetical protein
MKLNKGKERGRDGKKKEKLNDQWKERTRIMRGRSGKKKREEGGGEKGERKEKEGVGSEKRKEWSERRKRDTQNALIGFWRKCLIVR